MFKIDIPESHNITCFEYCYCAVLRYLGLNEEILYYSSFFSLNTVLDGMLKNNQNYLTYDSVGRLHHIGNDMDLVNFYMETGSFSLLEKNYSSHSLPLVVKIEPKRISLLSTASYLSEVDNHLVLLTDINTNVTFIDFISKKEFTLTRKKFEAGYDNTMYIMTLPDTVKTETDYLLKSVARFWEHIKTVISEDNVISALEVIQQDPLDDLMLTSTRDAVGICRVLSKRSLKYLNYLNNIYPELDWAELSDLQKQRLKMLDQVYLFIEYYKYKRKKMDEVIRNLTSISVIDMDMRRILKSML
ncbi:hypothetical protein [Paenibacillus tengchongensis]|uniref:hypothetical protein n=1 Tax=Paenibacillus tengchongensis TaxID=2608684 RepID=UPI00124C8992|nr:hypothetical protein [Paenibacillus tengchongensis]